MKKKDEQVWTVAGEAKGNKVHLGPYIGKERIPKGTPMMLTVVPDAELTEEEKKLPFSVPVPPQDFGLIFEKNLKTPPSEKELRGMGDAHLPQEFHDPKVGTIRVEGMSESFMKMTGGKGLSLWQPGPSFTRNLSPADLAKSLKEGNPEPGYGDSWSEVGASRSFQGTLPSGNPFFYFVTNCSKDSSLVFAKYFGHSSRLRGSTMLMGSMLSPSELLESKFACFRAACAVGDIPSALEFFRHTEYLVRRRDQNAPYMEDWAMLATSSFLPLFGRLMRYAGAAQDLAIWSIRVGEMWEALAALLPERRQYFLEQACQAYLVGFRAVFDPTELVDQAFMLEPASNLGLALKRAGYFNLAARAYIWGFRSQRPGEMLGSAIAVNARTLWEAMQLDSKRRNELNSQSLQRQRNVCKAKSVTVVETCHFCRLRLSEKKQRCSGCNTVYYCGAECQKKDWASHKTSCKKN